MRALPVLYNKKLNQLKIAEHFNIFSNNYFTISNSPPRIRYFCISLPKSINIINLAVHFLKLTLLIFISLTF